MDITLVIPVHAGIDQLESLFNAILELRLNGYKAECLFVVDNCKKSIFEIIQRKCRSLKANQWVSWLVIESDFGNPDQARDLGRQYAQGKVIAFLDDDCRPCPTWLVTGLSCMERNFAVTGPVLHADNVRGQLVAVMDFGEFQSQKTKNINNAPGCNLFVLSETIARYPVVSGIRYGGDRLLANSIASEKKYIGYYPDVAVCHHPPLHLSAIWIREIRYGNVAWTTRIVDPSLPWSSLLNYGFAALFLLTFGRFFMDLKRLWSGNLSILYKIMISFLLFPFRIAYLKGLIQASKKYRPYKRYKDCKKTGTL